MDKLRSETKRYPAKSFTGCPGLADFSAGAVHVDYLQLKGMKLIFT